MKRNLIILALGAVCVAPSQAGIVVTNWSSGFSAGGVIPGDGTGWWDTRTLSGLADPITTVTVRLNLSEALPQGNNGDLYAYLSHNGQLVVLLNRVGRTSANPDGYLDPGMIVTLSDAAATDIHDYGGSGFTQLTGTFQPDGRNIDPTSSEPVFDLATRQNSGHPLGLFSGMSANGDWTLFVSDHGAVGQSTLDSWGLTVDTAVVPEPAALWPAALMTVLALGWRWRRRL
jgi:hypothetical protein